MIDRLEEAGLVERRRDPGDRRAWLIFLTDKAKPIISELHTLANDLFIYALDGVDDAARSTTIATLNAIRANLSTHEPNEAAHG
jgi:DNA-binding MarR family transcriptional regulator